MRKRYWLRDWPSDSGKRIRSVKIIRELCGVPLSQALDIANSKKLREEGVETLAMEEAHAKFFETEYGVTLSAVDSETQFIVLIGTLENGVTAHGPYSSRNEASFKNQDHKNICVLELHRPE